MRREVPADEREKISLFTNVPRWGVISMWDVDTIYKVPRMLHEQGLDELICMKLQLFTKPANVLVLDEPTNDLDAETLELLEDLLGCHGWLTG